MSQVKRQIEEQNTLHTTALNWAFELNTADSSTDPEQVLHELQQMSFDQLIDDIAHTGALDKDYVLDELERREDEDLKRMAQAEEEQSKPQANIDKTTTDTDQYIRQTNALLNFVMKGDSGDDDESHHFHANDLKTQLPWEAKMESALYSLIGALDLNDEEDGVENALVVRAMMEGFCNGLYFRANNEKQKLYKALDELATAEKQNDGSEVSSTNIESKLIKVESVEARINKLRRVYKVFALTCYPEIMQDVHDALPDYMGEWISLKFEPYKSKSQFKKDKSKQKVNSASVAARDKLSKYKR